MRNLKIGDTILGTYHGVRFVGVVDGYDGSGNVYVSFPAPLPEPFISGTARDMIMLDRQSEVFLVSRPAPLEAADLITMPRDCIGGTSIRKAARRVPTLAELEAAGKAAVARKDESGAAALRLVYRAVRDAESRAVPAAA